MTPADYTHIGLSIMAVLLVAWLIEVGADKVRR